MSRTPRTLWIKAIRKCDGRCWFCGREAKTIDHATPRARGGRNSIENLLPACVWCNNTKADMTVSQLRKYIKALIVRQMIENGMIWGGTKGLVVLFYGEGCENPLKY